MEDKNSPNKIKVEKQIYWGSNNGPMTWEHIKHLQLEDNDVIRSEWVEDDDFDYNGYWYNEITRMVEETDNQFATRQWGIERNNIWLKEQRFKSYLKLKEEFEDGK